MGVDGEEHQAVILAAGLGRRMAPLSREVQQAGRLDCAPQFQKSQHSVSGEHGWPGAGPSAPPSLR